MIYNIKYKDEYQSIKNALNKYKIIPIFYKFNTIIQRYYSIEYLNKYNLDEPIFLEEIKQHVINKRKNNESNVLSNINDIINRIHCYILEC